MDLVVVKQNTVDCLKAGLISKNAASKILNHIESSDFPIVSIEQKQELSNLFHNMNCNVDSDGTNYVICRRTAIPPKKALFFVIQSYTLSKILVKILGRPVQEIDEILNNWEHRFTDRRIEERFHNIWVDFLIKFSLYDDYFVPKKYLTWLAWSDNDDLVNPWGSVNVNCLPRLLGLPGEIPGVRRFALKISTFCCEGRDPTVLDGNLDYWRAGGYTISRSDIEALCGGCKRAGSSFSVCLPGFRETVREGLPREMIYPPLSEASSLADIFTLCLPLRP